MRHFSVKDFERFQHYKDRSPPWIKLYNELLDDYEFGLLPDASKMHLIAIWLLASRYSNKIPADAEWISKRINATEPVDLEALADAGFILMDQGCSKTLAERKQSAMPEREGEAETETEISVPSEHLSAKADDVDEVYRLWNDLAEEYSLPKARKTQGPSLKNIRRRLKEHGLAGWRAAFDGVRGSPHHQGENDGGWRADLPWLALPRNFEKLMMRGETYGQSGGPAARRKHNPRLEASRAGMAAAFGAKD